MFDLFEEFNQNKLLVRKNHNINDISNMNELK